MNHHHEIALALAKCTFLPGSWDKRFARDMAAAAKISADLTTKQAAHVLRLGHKYRRQLPTEIVCLVLNEWDNAFNETKVV